MKTIKWNLIVLVIMIIVIAAFPVSAKAATKGKTYIFSLNGNLQEDGKYKNMNDLILQIFFTNERYNNSVKSKYMLNQYNTSNSKSEKQVLDAIKKAFSGSNSSDLGVFLYNGHGFDTGKALALSSNNAVTYKNLAQTLASTGCGRFLVIINACHSGGFIDNGIKKLSYKDRQRFHVITSCKTSENSYKSETDGSSYYMECIVNALEYNTDGKWSGYIACDVNHDKKIDICEIYAYSKDYLRRKYGDKTQQTPQQYSLNSDEAIFAYKPLSIKLNYSSKDLYENETVQLTAMVSGNGSGVTWSSSNNAVATVSKGKVKAIKKGTATITATVVLLGKKYSKTCTINVKSKNNTVNDASISLSKTSLTIQKGKSTTLKATVKGKSKTVTWKSSDKTIATVDKSGKVTGKKEGTATITATANGVSAKCKVTVINTDLSVSKNAVKSILDNRSVTVMVDDVSQVFIIKKDDIADISIGKIKYSNNSAYVQVIATIDRDIATVRAVFDLSYTMSKDNWVFEKALQSSAEITSFNFKGVWNGIIEGNYNGSKILRDAELKIVEYTKDGYAEGTAHLKPTASAPGTGEAVFSIECKVNLSSGCITITFTGVIDNISNLNWGLAEKYCKIDLKENRIINRNGYSSVSLKKS